MDKIIVCTNCQQEIERSEVYLTNALKYSCADCFEEWDMEDAYITDNNLYADNYFYET